MSGAYAQMSLADRLWSRVEKTDGCWLWTKKRIGGYGVLMYQTKQLKAHRVSYELAYGAIPDGLIVCHDCDNPPCVRPSHLFLGTHLDNHADAVAKGRKNEKRLADWRPGLTDDQRREVRELYQNGVSSRDIRRRFGVSRSHIFSIIKGVAMLGRNPRARSLSVEDVKQIRQLYVRNSGGFGTHALAVKYDVNQSTIWAIVNNKTWRTFDET